MTELERTILLMIDPKN